MKRLLLISILCLSALLSHAQQPLLAYEDITHILNNNLEKVDEFLQSKGYIPAGKKLKPGNKKYAYTFADGSKSDLEIRADAKKLYIYLATDNLEQYNLINNSITPFLLKQEYMSDILNYQVKDLGNIYVMVSEKVPYHPLKKDYDIRIVSDKNITAYN